MLDPRQQLIKDIYGKEPETLDEIAEACISVINKTDTVIGFAWDIKYTSTVGNSHYAPLSGHQNWGGSNKAAKGVRSYPGFSGRVWIRYAGDPTMSFGAHGNFNKTLTYPGSGGGGAYDGIWQGLADAAFRIDRHNTTSKRKYPELHLFSWDFRLFLTDFPAYEAEFNKQLDKFNQEVEWDLLKNRNIHATFAVSHHFEWEDAETKAADAAFLKIANERYRKETV